MGIRAGQLEISVTDYAKVKATNRPLPDLRGKSCVAGIDYVEINDWGERQSALPCGRTAV